MTNFPAPRFPSLLAAILLAAPPLAAEAPLEADLDPFLGDPRMDSRSVFTDERFPNVVVTLEGTVLLTWGREHIRARRSEDGGATFGDEITIARPGFQGGGTLVDERSGDILAFVEESHPPARLTVYRSGDDGLTWTPQETVIESDSLGHAPSMHMNESGITLRHGDHAGRLLRAARYYGAGNERQAWPEHYTNAIYSDDGGRTWKTSDPFPENGTGEAAVAELADGRLYYNSRLHWEERPGNTRRRHAYSGDGGHTWMDWAVVEILPDGRQDNSYGCMGGLVRLPVEGRDILVYSNIDTPNPERERLTVWASFDGGRSWPVKRLVDEGRSAYSSLNAGRPGTPSEGWIYLFYEGGEEGAAQLARFNLAWILGGETTGDGEVPELGTPLSWSPLPPLPDPYGLGGPLVGITGGQLIVAGGANFPIAPGEDLWTASKVWHSAVYRFPIDEGDEGEWSPLPPMEAPLGYSAVVSTRHGIACLGGEHAEGPVAGAFLLRWHEESGRLRQIPLPDLPGPMAFGSAAAIGDAIYLAGGLARSSLDSALHNFWRLDLAPLDRGEAPQWEVLPPWPGPARGLNLTVAQRCGGEIRIYVVSGRRQRPGTEGLEGLEVLPDVYEFRPSTGTWRERAPMPRPLNAGTGGALGDRHLVVLSGDDGALVTQIEILKDGHPGFPREAWAYDTEADAWSQAGETPANQVTTPAVAHEDSLLLVSGELRPRVRARESWRVRLPPGPGPE